jgi:hypothetical protein
MKIVDLVVVSRLHVKISCDSILKRRGNTMALMKTRVDHEDAVKLRAMKEYMFGKFVTRVPVLKEDRYRDLPLPESSAAPYQLSLQPLAELAMQDVGYRRKRLVGQHITGKMIPQVSLLMRMMLRLLLLPTHRCCDHPGRGTWSH